MGGSGTANWLRELEHPSAEFFKAFAVLAAEGRAEDAAREAVARLTPAVDWAAYLPHVPHGLLGLQAVFRLRPLLSPASFQRALATQLHAFAHDSRSPAGRGLAAIGKGSGHWGNLTMALGHHRPAIAWGEALAMAEVQAEPFRLLERAAEADMANVGHKSVLARQLGELFLVLGRPAEAGRVLLAMAAWHCAAEPFDCFWHDRAAKRLEAAPEVPFTAARATAAEHRAVAREVCDSGLVDLLDRFSARVRSSAGSGDLLAVLALAAAEKQLDARRDLEAKTSWNFVFLACLAKRAAEAGRTRPETWVQAAALVNLFPTGEDEDCPRPAPTIRSGDPAPALLDAILDGEPPLAMALAQELRVREGLEPLLGVLAEAAADNDPVFNHSHQILAVAAGAELMPHLPDHAQEAVLVALAKSLANGQGSSDLGRLAEAALRAEGIAAGQARPVG
jgi:hypothetical protein